MAQAGASVTDRAGGTNQHAPPSGAVADLDVVIVGYRSRQLLGPCLDSVRDAREHLRVSVVVVDNDSEDGTVEAVLARSPETGLETTVLSTGRNAGFSVASNRGIAGGRAPYVMLLNPDTVVGPGVLPSLVRFADDHPQAGVVAPGLTNADGSDQLTARAFPTAAAAVFGRRSPLTRWFPRNRWSSRFLAGRGRSAGGEPFQVDWVSGAAMLVPRHVIDEVGALDEGFFLFWEDADWCRRIKDAGYEVWCLPSVHVVHDEGGTRGHSWSWPTLRWFHAGAYRYWRKHHAPQPWNPLRWLAATLLTLRAVALCGRYRLRDIHLRHQEIR